jgi:hypothetical protein
MESIKSCGFSTIAEALHVLLHNSVIPPVIAGLATLSTEDSVELCGGARARGLYEETQIDVGKMIWTTEVN